VPGEGSLTQDFVPTSLARADLVFRLAGAGALALLAATAVLLAMDVEAWHPIFAFAHLAALIALAPLGVLLVARAFAEARREGEPGITGVWRRHRRVAVVLGIVAITVAVSLLNFQDGIRWLRRVANLTTVVLVLVLVARYLWWRREAFRS
jgi:peptidoglycan/LPS O-acetylase OafA/YrhL